MDSYKTELIGISYNLFPTYLDGKRVFVNNAKAMHSILCGLIEYALVKVMQRGSTKKICNKLQRSYGGNEKVERAKLQTHII